MQVLKIYKTKIIGLNVSENNLLYYNDCALNIVDNEYAEIFASIKASHDTDYVSISIYLQCYNDEGWSTVKFWIQNYDNTYGLLNLKYEVEREYEYRTLVNFYAYHGDYAEWIAVVVD